MVYCTSFKLRVGQGSLARIGIPEESPADAMISFFNRMYMSYPLLCAMYDRSPIFGEFRVVFLAAKSCTGVVVELEGHA